MKTVRRMALAAVLLAALVAAGCGKAGNTRQNGPDGQMPAMSGTMGIITEVSETSITITVMPQGETPQGGGTGRMPEGSGAPARPSGTGRPAGTAPAGDGEQRPMASRDTSGWEKKTYKIDGSTRIVRMQFGNSSTSASLKASDLAAGDSVSIEESESSAGTAGAVTVMQGMGGPAPASAGKSE